MLDDKEEYQIHHRRLTTGIFNVPSASVVFFLRIGTVNVLLMTPSKRRGTCTN